MHTFTLHYINSAASFILSPITLSKTQHQTFGLNLHVQHILYVIHQFYSVMSFHFTAVCQHDGSIRIINPADKLQGIVHDTLATDSVIRRKPLEELEIFKPLIDGFREKETTVHNYCYLSNFP